MLGILPAGGLATRLGPLKYPKELLPITRADDGTPRPVIALSLAQMERARITACTVVISEAKLELVRVLGESVHDVALAYVVRAQPRGLADAVALACQWQADRTVALALPDTILDPPDALAQVRAELEASGADLVLGVFPTDRPHELGPVRVGADGAVREVLDKPAITDLATTWGLAAWTPRFTALLTEAVDADPAANLGAIFQRAIASLNVRAVSFAAGRFLDAGTPAGLAEALRL